MYLNIDKKTAKSNDIDLVVKFSGSVFNYFLILGVIRHYTSLLLNLAEFRASSIFDDISEKSYTKYHQLVINPTTFIF